MKKFVFILAVVPVLFVIVNCRDGSVPPLPATRKFWAQNMVTQTFYQINAAKLAENSICEVWAESGNAVAAATASNVANAYNTVYTKMMNTFGYKVNVQLSPTSIKTMDTMELAHYIATGETSGAKLTILLLDIKDGYQPGVSEPYTSGYFYVVDLYERYPSDNRKYSNELDMIYVDTYPSVPGSESSNETIAHEMQHLMNFISTVVLKRGVMDTWVNEGLSTAAEWVYSGIHPEGRWEWYNKDRSGEIEKGNNFFMWDNRKVNPRAILDDYATVYLFFQWLRLQSGNSALPRGNIYREILLSEFNDYTAVTDVAKSSIHSSYSDWSFLLRDWLAANFINAEGGLYGYKNDSTLKKVKAPMHQGGGITSVSLFPGEGVYSKIASTETIPASSDKIKYAGLSSTGGSPVVTGSASGARLTYNVDTNLNGLPATGSITGVDPSMGISITDVSGSVQTASNKFSGPFKVDAGYFLRRNGGRGIPDDETVRNVISTNNGRSGGEDNSTLKFDLSTLEMVNY